MWLNLLQESRIYGPAWHNVGLGISLMKRTYLSDYVIMHIQTLSVNWGAYNQMAALSSTAQFEKHAEP